MDKQHDGHPVEDFLRPKLDVLIKSALAEGYQRDVVLAVLIDLLDNTGSEGDVAP